MPQRSTYLIASLLLICLFWLSQRAGSTRPVLPSPDSKSRISGQHAISSARQPYDDLPCKHLPGAEDVLVIMKTGSTEFEDKLPIHLNTTLRCYQDYMIFSDYEETFHGEHIYDALEFVNPDTQESHQDFELWRRLRKEGGRTALRATERSGPISRPQGATGKPFNPGWKLDKWKFLPMVNRTLNEWPDKKWYLFVETDTYVLWQTFLNYVAVLDSTQPVYIGGQIWIGDVVFAHGGTGFAVSNPAMQLVVRHFQEHQKEWEDYTNWHWAGDCVLGKAMKDSGAPLTHAWPIWQADDIGDMNYARSENGMRLWCMPTVSYHHLSPTVVESMWNWEQDWIREVNDPSATLHHRDVYNHYILPQVVEPRQNWDNHADQDQGPVASLAECGDICESLEKCVQYALSLDLRCLTTSKPNLGEWSRGIDSGWIYDRMKAFHDDAGWCLSNKGWIVP